MSLIVGLTGGIGCGKSTVADLFEKHGAGIIDTDVIARHLTQACPDPGRGAGGEAMTAIRAAFGDDYITNDGALDRAKMRGLIFSDNTAKQRLEKILHPLILEQAMAQVLQLQSRPYIILVAPLLPESPAFQQQVQRLLVVDCDEETQVTRVTGRSYFSAQEVRNIIARQTPRAERLRLADDVIHNEAGLETLAAQVDALHERYLNSRR